MDEEPDIGTEETEFVYPRIESIYSNVGNIKLEPIDYEENDYESTEIAEYDHSNEYYMPFPNKIILGSKPSIKSSLEPIPHTSTTPDVWLEQKNYECDSCNLLFPTENELDSHKMATHSYLVPRPMSRAMKSSTMSSVSSISSQSYIEDSSSQESTMGRQKAVKSTAKSSLLNRSFPLLKARNNIARSFINMKFLNVNHGTGGMDSEYTDKLLCKHCDVQFPNEIALIKHTYELLPEQNFKCDRCSCAFSNTKDLRAHSLCHNVHNQFAVVPENREYLQCTVCSCYLKYPTGLKNHMFKNHRTHDYVIKLGKFNGQCTVCDKYLLTQRQYNKHIANIHTKVYTARTPFKSKVTKNPVDVQKNNTFSIRNHTNLKVHPPKLKPKSQLFKLSKILTVKDPPIPKQVLFKCNKCQIHFVTCSKAYEHSKRCVLAKGDWKCNKCRRSFTQVERLIHTLQHGVSDKFKVHIVDDKIVSRVLCRCPKCEMHFDENSFWQHVSTDCETQIGSDCIKCHLKIDKDSRMKHRRSHNLYNYTRSDYIVVEFAEASVHDESSSEATDDTKCNTKTLLFCVNCKTHLCKVRENYMHMSGKCRRLDKRYCQLCGLLFTSKTIKRHTIMAHQEQNLKLCDFTFVRIQDNVQIAPPMPEFFQCDKCSVRFSTLSTKKSHICKIHDAKQCLKCLEKYDAVTYDLHLNFHEYENNFQEEASSSNGECYKFYSCISCKYGFYTYDNLVEHCQEHYTDTETLTGTLCKFCKLSYMDSKHNEVHFSRKSYKILKFNHENLLSDDWLTGFGPVRKDEIDEILGKSVYGVLRNVRLQVLSYGPRDRSLYKCVQCQLCCEPEGIVEHTKEPCTNTVQHECESCEATFQSKGSLHKHTKLHVIFGDDIKFTLITFNDALDRDLNEALRTGRRKESLKFRKCQQCELLIKKNEYQTHIEAHNKNKCDDVVDRADMKKGFSINQTEDAKRKMYTVYQCKSCKSTIMNRVNIIRHSCGPPNSTEQCNKCSLWFRVCSSKRHVDLHTALPKFVTNNITVVEFELHNTGGPVAKKRRRYSSDGDASILSLPISNTVQKTYGTRVNRVEKVFNDFSMESEDSQDNMDYIPEVKEELDESESLPEIDKWIVDKKYKLYQCKKCYLCFVLKKVLLMHQLTCKIDSSSATAFVCNLCDLIIHPSLTWFHEKLHEYVNMNTLTRFYYLIQVSTNGIDEFKEKNWLYKCKACEVYYITYRALEYHFSNNHKSVHDYVDCDHCHLKFTLHTRTKHIKLHHYKSNRLQNNFNVEIAEEGLINRGELSLTPLDVTLATEVNTAEVDKNVDDNKELNCMDKDSEISNAVDKTLANVNNENDTENNVAVETDTGKDLDASEAEYSKVQYIDVKRNGSAVDNNLYKCTVCSVHYINKHTLVCHVKSENHLASTGICNECGLIFGSRTLEKHKMIQHKKLKLTRDDFIISTITGEMVKIDPFFVPKMEMSDRMSAHDYETNDDLHNENGILRVDGAIEMSKPIRTYEPSVLGHNVYKCVECSIHYINKGNLLTHVVTRKHAPSRTLDCDICGLKFDSGSLANHKSVQHDKLKLTLKDLIITDYVGSRVHDGEENEEDAKCPPSSAADELLSGDQEHKVVEKDRLKIFKLYKCKDCGVCVQKTLRKLHVCCSDIQKIYCVNCSLSFRRIDLLQHRRLHKKHPGLSRINFSLTKFGCRRISNRNIYKCVSCSTHFVSLQTLEWHMDTWKHNTKRVRCTVCGLYFGKLSLSRHMYLHHTKMNLKIDQCNIVCVDADTNVAGTKESDITNASDIKPEPVDSVPNSKNIVLFKCFECDVYFLNQESYYEHIYKHTNLDPTEFIACKMCDLQFLTNTLGEHMKGHRDKTFSLDKVLIEGYQPNSIKSTKIERFLNVDRLNSKLVSTTTLFDEDVTIPKRSDEQLSTIDSTSDELPRTTQSTVVANNES